MSLAEPSSSRRVWRRGLTTASVVLIVAAAIALIWQISAGRDEAQRLTEVGERQVAISREVAALMRGMIDSETGMRGYAVTGGQAYLETYKTGRAQAKAATDALSKLIAAVPSLRAGYDEIVRREASAAALIGHSVELARAGRGRQALITSLDDGKAAMDSLRMAADALSASATAEVRDANTRARLVRRQVGALILLLMTLFVISNGIAGLIVYGERRQMRDMAAQLVAANATLAEARAAAEAADAAKTRFLALASHDMRQPLHAMTLYLAALGRRVEGAQAKEILGNMEMAAQSLTRMFSGLLDLARIESGVLKAKPAPTPLQSVFDAVTAEMRDDAKRTKTELRVVRTGAVVVTDPELLQSVLRNLVTNAIKYAGGKRVLIGARRQAGAMRIFVCDEGPGIPKDKLMFVFGEFVRLDSTPAGVDGLGLGLSIASRLAKLLGQTLDVKSVVGKGAAFSIAMPLAGAAHDDEAAPTPDERPDLTGLRVAVMDDDALALAAMAAVLEDAGANVQAMSNAKQYVEALDSGAVHDVVILDPVLLGEASIAVRKREGYVAPPLIVVTGSTDAATLARLEASNLAWLIKPVKEEALLQTAARVARAPRPEPVSAAR
jgi:signal transduction histidine kinase